jgi:hypothetical protein
MLYCQASSTQEESMIKVYLNYVQYHVTIHHDMACCNIQSNNKPDQRYVRINNDTITTVFQDFANRQHLFASTAERNDMWLEIDFDDVEFEEAVTEHIRKMLSNYKHFAETTPTHHC